MLPKRVPIAPRVVDTVRQTSADTGPNNADPRSSFGGFAFGLGSGKRTNTVPFGFNISGLARCFEEALRVIRLQWNVTRIQRLRDRYEVGRIHRGRRSGPTAFDGFLGISLRIRRRV